MGGVSYFHWAEPKAWRREEVVPRRPPRAPSRKLPSRIRQTRSGSLFGNASWFDNPDAYVPSDVFSKYNCSNALIDDARDLGGVEGDLDADEQIYRIPRQLAAVSLVYDGIAKLEIEPRLALVGARLGENFQTHPHANVAHAAWAKPDLLANYRVEDNPSVFARADILTNAAYREMFGDGVAERSFHGGLSFTR